MYAAFLDVRQAYIRWTERTENSTKKFKSNQNYIEWSKIKLKDKKKVSCIIEKNDGTIVQTDKELAEIIEVVVQ